ncbi:MAG: 30S ribosomal protein S18 [Nitrospinota bacterium]
MNSRFANDKTATMKRLCRFCTDNVDNIDYKNVALLKNLLSERGKIAPSRISGSCSHHQRKVTIAIKRARQIALIPYTYSVK